MHAGTLGLKAHAFCFYQESGSCQAGLLYTDTLRSWVQLLHAIEHDMASEPDCTLVKSASMPKITLRAIKARFRCERTTESFSAYGELHCQALGVLGS